MSRDERVNKDEDQNGGTRVPAKNQVTLRCHEARHSRKVMNICSNKIHLEGPSMRASMHANRYSTALPKEVVLCLW